MLQFGLLAMVLFFCSAVFAPDTFAQGKGNIYGMKGGSRAPKNIFGTRRLSNNSGQLYGEHGANLGHNYFGTSKNTANDQKKHSLPSDPPKSWDEVSPRQTPVNSSSPEQLLLNGDWESF